MRKKYNKLNLQQINLRLLDRCLIGIVAVLIILVLMIFNIYIYQADKKQFALIQLVMEQTAENQKEQFEGYISDKIQLLQVLATYPDIYEMDEKKQKAFIEERSEKLGFEHMFVVNADGNGYYIDEDIHRDHKEDPFLADIMTNDIFVTKPFYAGDNLIFMTACVSIYNAQGEKTGSLCGAISLEKLQQIIEKNEMVLNGECFIIDEQGKYMTATRFAELYGQKSMYAIPNSDISLVKKAFEKQKSQTGIYTLNGTEYQVNVTYLEQYNWGIVQSVPVHEIEARYGIMSNLYYLLVFLTSVLIFGVARIIYCWKASDKKIYTDILTKCNNRAACMAVLERLENCKKFEITIVYMDLNKFKFVNDTYGHDKGDEILCIFSEALMNTFGKAGFVGRMGGDEFVSILVDVKEEQIVSLWKNLHKELKEQSKKLDFPYVISSSYGYFTRPKDNDMHLEEVMQNADKKMYEYKVAKQLYKSGN